MPESRKPSPLAAAIAFVPASVAVFGGGVSIIGTEQPATLFASCSRFLGHLGIWDQQTT